MALNDSIKKAITKKLPAVTSTDSLKTAIKAMADANTSAVVVFTGDELVGIVTEMDLMNGVANQQSLDSEVASVMTVCDLITNKAAVSPCIQLDEDQSAQSALAIMNEAGVHHLLVSGQAGKAVGVISAQQLLKLAIT